MWHPIAWASCGFSRTNTFWIWLVRLHLHNIHVTLHVSLLKLLRPRWFVGNWVWKSLCGRSTQDLNSQNNNHSTVAITRLYDTQTWLTHFLRNSRGVQRYVACFAWLFVIFGYRLASGQENYESATRNEAKQCFRPITLVLEDFHVLSGYFDQLSSACAALNNWEWSIIDRLDLAYAIDENRSIDINRYQLPYWYLPVFSRVLNFAKMEEANFVRLKFRDLAEKSW